MAPPSPSTPHVGMPLPYDRLAMVESSTAAVADGAEGVREDVGASSSMGSAAAESPAASPSSMGSAAAASSSSMVSTSTGLHHAPAPSCHARQSQVPPAIPDHASRPSLNPPASHAHRSRVCALLIAPHAAHSQILRCQWKARPRRRRWKVHAFDGERTARRAYPYPDFTPLCPAHTPVDGRDPDSARPRGVEVFGRHLHLHIAVPIKIIIIQVAFLVLSQIAGLGSCKSPSAWPQDKTHQRPCWNRGRSRRTRADRRACLASRQSPSLSGLFLSL